MKHTPGTWYQRDGVVYTDNLHRSFIIAECRDSIIHSDDGERNAILISAAPDLLEVLQEVNNRYSSLMTEKMRNKMKVAINKAKGL